MPKISHDLQVQGPLAGLGGGGGGGGGGGAGVLMERHLP